MHRVSHQGTLIGLLAGSVILALAVGVSAATKYRVYIMAGQSNNIGYNPGGAAQLPDSLKQPQKNVKIYGICGMDDDDPGSTSGGLVMHYGCCDSANAATKGWQVMQPQWWCKPSDGCEVGAYISFGHNMAKLYPNDSIAIIMAGDITALGDRWRSPSAVGGAGSYFPLFIKGVRTAIANLNVYGQGNTGQIAGMMWMQGELDATESGWANAYKANLTALVKDVRDSLGANLPFVIGMISTASEWPLNSTVRKAETDVAAAVANVGIVDTKNFPMANGGHYTGLGEVMLGNGYTTEMMKLTPTVDVMTNKKPHARNRLALTSGMIVDRASTMTIHDMRGRTVRTANLEAGAALDMRAQSAGAYFVSVNSGRDEQVGKVVVQR